MYQLCAAAHKVYLGCKQRIRSAVNDRIGIEPGQVHPFSSVNPSGGRSGVGAKGVAGLASPETLLWAGTFKGAATKLHRNNAARVSLLLSIAEFYQYSPE
jgi:hypothetical protein